MQFLKFIYHTVRFIVHYPWKSAGEKLLGYRKADDITNAMLFLFGMCVASFLSGIVLGLSYAYWWILVPLVFGVVLYLSRDKAWARFFKVVYGYDWQREYTNEREAFWSGVVLGAAISVIAIFLLWPFVVATPAVFMRNLIALILWLEVFAWLRRR